VELLRPFVERDPDVFCFDASESVAWHRQQNQAALEAPLYASHLARYERSQNLSTDSRPASSMIEPSLAFGSFAADPPSPFAGTYPATMCYVHVLLRRPRTISGHPLPPT